MPTGVYVRKKRKAKKRFYKKARVPKNFEPDTNGSNMSLAQYIDGAIATLFKIKNHLVS